MQEGSATSKLGTRRLCGSSLRKVVKTYASGDSKSMHGMSYLTQETKKFPLSGRSTGVHQSTGMAQGVKKTMETLPPLAGKAAPREMLVDISKLERAYFDTSPD